MNNHHKIFTSAKVERRRQQLDEAVSRHLSHLDAANRQEKLEKLRSELDKLMAIETKFAVADVFSYVEVVDGCMWMRPDGVKCFAGDLPEQEQKLVWATRAARRHGLDIEAELVHRREQRPRRSARVRTLRSEALYLPIASERRVRRICPPPSTSTGMM